MNRILLMVFTILLAGSVGFAVARATAGMEARMAATGAAIAVGEGQGCALSARSVWRTGLGEELGVEAHTLGPDCPTAVAVLTIRGAAQGVYGDVFRVDQVFSLADAASSAATLGPALAAWIAADPQPRTSDSLLAWKAGDDQPGAGQEFPFYQEAWMDRDTYEGIRAARAPMFCFVQGMESEACLVIRDGGIEKVGAQSFPG